MTRRHLSRMAAPKTWPLSRKGVKFVLRPMPGPHSLETGMPLGVVLKELLHVGSNMEEIKHLLRSKEVLIDGKKIINHKQSIGFMDVLSLPTIHKNYRVTLGKTGKLHLAEVSDKDAHFKICKITGKNFVPGKTQMAYLHDGKSISTTGDLRVGDSIVYEFASKKIERLPLKEGVQVLLTGGSHKGVIGTLAKIEPRKEDDDIVVIKTHEMEFLTLKKFVFVVGKDKSMILGN